jgi:hypothetical protein
LDTQQNAGAECDRKPWLETLKMLEQRDYNRSQPGNDKEKPDKMKKLKWLF